MSIGNSGRVVIEIKPELKRELYAALSMNGKTLKDWFISQAEHYLREGQQLSFFDDMPPAKQVKNGGR